MAIPVEMLKRKLDENFRLTPYGNHKVLDRTMRSYKSRHNLTGKKPRVNFLSKIIQQAFILSTALQNI